MISMKTMDLILIIIAIFIIIFTIMMFVTFWRFAMIPDTLCTCFFACVGSECGVMGWIKTTKERHENRKWQLEDEERMKENNHD